MSFNISQYKKFPKSIDELSYQFRVFDEDRFSKLNGRIAIEDTSFEAYYEL